MSEPIDALFVVHQDVDLADIAKQCREDQAIVLLTTHKLFANEEAMARKLCKRVHVVTFSDLLDDAALVACDEQATRELTARDDDGAYDVSFRAKSLALKNRLAHEKLAVRYNIAAIHYSDGLGVSGAYWDQHGGKPLAPSAQATPIERVRELWGHATAELEMLPEVTVIADRFVFFGSTKRLRIRAGHAQRTVALGMPRALLRSPRLAGAFVKRRLRDLPADWQPCTTIHEYRRSHSALAEALGRELLIFVDGHHPSNYPRAYLDMYASGTFVVAARPSAQWFEQFGRRVLPPFSFQQSEQFARCEAKPVQTVLLVMNHAGDWTSLINRSDSDALIAAFADFAAARPTLTCVLRLHPTMALPAHEGIHSIERVRRFVAGLRLPNLSVSNATLDEDLSRADLYLSEYSQVLIDAWRTGKLGVVVNLTGRRSFMADYERVGFPAATSLPEMLGLAGRIEELAAQQDAAVDSLNRLQANWEHGDSFDAVQ